MVFQEYTIISLEFMIYMIYGESLLLWIIINSNDKIIESLIVK